MEEGCGVSVTVWVAEAVALGVSEGCGEGVSDGVGLEVGLGVGVRVSVGVREGVKVGKRVGTIGVAEVTTKGEGVMVSVPASAGVGVLSPLRSMDTNNKPKP